MNKISFIFVLFSMFPYIGLAQSPGNKTVYTLSPLLSVKPKIYVLNESDLWKHQLPKNYMIVKNPLKDILTLWEFPNEFPAEHSQQLQSDIQRTQSTNNIMEKQKLVGEQKSAPEPTQIIKLLELLGLGSDKEVSMNNLNKSLPGLNIK
jgi:hypothetical protein